MSRSQRRHPSHTNTPLAPAGRIDADHIYLQYRRLERHYQEALQTRDPVSFLDLAHCLRIWVDLKPVVDQLVEQRNLTLRLSHTVTPKSMKDVLRGSNHTYLPLGTGVEGPPVQVKGLTIINRVLSPDERKALYEAGVPSSKPSSLRYSEWLASGVYEVPTGNSAHAHLRISREMLIKRVANILGASHPMGTEEGDASENRFDPYVRDLHTIQLADGYPATYYQLLEIAGEILDALKVLWDTPSLPKQS